MELDLEILFLEGNLSRISTYCPMCNISFMFHVFPLFVQGATSFMFDAFLIFAQSDLIYDIQYIICMLHDSQSVHK